MLDNSVIAEVQRLLAEGRWSQREVSRRTGVSRAVVAEVAAGRRELRLIEADGDDTLGEARGPLVRCPECGARVRLPCVACRARAHLRLRAGSAAARERPSRAA